MYFVSCRNRTNSLKKIDVPLSHLAPCLPHGQSQSYPPLVLATQCASGWQPATSHGFLSVEQSGPARPETHKHAREAPCSMQAPAESEHAWELHSEIKHLDTPLPCAKRVSYKMIKF